MERGAVDRSISRAGCKGAHARRQRAGAGPYVLRHAPVWPVRAPAGLRWHSAVGGNAERLHRRGRLRSPPVHATAAARARRGRRLLSGRRLRGPRYMRNMRGAAEVDCRRGAGAGRNSSAALAGGASWNCTTSGCALDARSGRASRAGGRAMRRGASPVLVLAAQRARVSTRRRVAD